MVCASLAAILRCFDNKDSRSPEVNYLAKDPVMPADNISISWRDLSLSGIRTLFLECIDFVKHENGI